LRRIDEESDNDYLKVVFKRLALVERT
jgi:hypothetical protein